MTIKDLIDRWTTRKQLADEIGANVASVHKWAEADRIPSRWQASVVRAARVHGFNDITGEWMVQAHSQERAKAS